ncbi:MAG: hypothetical protein ABIE74_02760 [Pseudomonadota bacterium]
MAIGSLPVVNAAKIDFSRGTQVISAAQKFVIPVPALGAAGEALVYPAGSDKAGQLIVDWQGKKGIVFWNAKDSAWQAAAGDGNAVIIMNQVTVDQALQLYAAYVGLGNPEELSLTSLKTFLKIAETEVGIGDMYNSDRGFIARYMTPVDRNACLVQAYSEVFGHMKRDARDVSSAVYIQEPFQLETVTVTAQLFENGGVVLLQPGQEARGIQPDVFQETYRLADGGKEITDLNKQIHTVQQAAVGKDIV